MKPKLNYCKYLVKKMKNKIKIKKKVLLKFQIYKKK